MGRGSGEWQMADINGLLDEHARLAYHSARATDSDFQLDLKDEYDPNTGEMEVIPQDLGRVFLNMVSNACYATNERRAATPGADVVGGPYTPTIWLSTKRLEDHVEVRIKDNGTGMPPEVVEKIFNPFFTTKPTDQGTGLGLSLSSDIVRRHGGTIRVDSVEGEHTEMIIELPLERPAETTAACGRGPGAGLAALRAQGLAGFELPLKLEQRDDRTSVLGAGEGGAILIHRQLRDGRGCSDAPRHQSR